MVPRERRREAVRGQSTTGQTSPTLAGALLEAQVLQPCNENKLLRRGRKPFVRERAPFASLLWIYRANLFAITEISSRVKRQFRCCANFQLFKQVSAFMKIAGNGNFVVGKMSPAAVMLMVDAALLNSKQRNDAFTKFDDCKSSSALSRFGMRITRGNRALCEESDDCRFDKVLRMWMNPRSLVVRVCICLINHRQ